MQRHESVVINGTAHLQNNSKSKLHSPTCSMLTLYSLRAHYSYSTCAWHSWERVVPWVDWRPTRPRGRPQALVARQASAARSCWICSRREGGSVRVCGWVNRWSRWEQQILNFAFAYWFRIRKKWIGQSVGWMRRLTLQQEPSAWAVDRKSRLYGARPPGSEWV